MDQSQQDLVAQFCGITGSDASSAQATLELAQWNLEQAVTLHYTSQEDSEGDDQEDNGVVPSQPTSSLATQPAASSTSSGRRPPQNSSRLRTLRDIQPSAHDDDDDDDKDRDLFAGGEKSGLAVQNPGSGSTADHFRNIMNQARQNRDRPPPTEEEEEEQPRNSNFAGRAQTLGGDDAPSQVIEDPTAIQAGRRSTRPERITRTMHLWADGVSIDDGPLFRFDDPNNAHIMAQINRGQAPLSLLDVQPEQEVDLTLEPHKEQNYVQPKKKYKAFSGHGQRLGSPTPGPNPGASASSSQAPAAPAAKSTSEAPTVSLDESTPTITLQIRLGDGTRLTSRFNTTHTIGDVYGFVDSASAQSTQRAYVLMTTFPSKELEDKSQVLGDISDFKRGGVVVQKWK